MSLDALLLMVPQLLFIRLLVVDVELDAELPDIRITPINDSP